MKFFFKAGDIVKLKDSYDGYFANFHNKNLKVIEVVAKDSSLEEDCLRIKEFQEAEGPHLVGCSHFEMVSSG